MTSSDHEILISINGKIESIANRVTMLESTTAEIRRDISDIKQEQIILRHDMENLQHSVYWIFAALGIFIAAVPILSARYAHTDTKDNGIRLTLSQFSTLVTERLHELKGDDTK